MQRNLAKNEKELLLNTLYYIGKDQKRQNQP